MKSRPRLVFCFLLFLVQSADSVAPRAAALSLSTCARVCLVAARGLCYRCTHARGRGPGGGGHVRAASGLRAAMRRMRRRWGGAL